VTPPTLEETLSRWPSGYCAAWGDRDSSPAWLWRSSADVALIPRALAGQPRMNGRLPLNPRATGLNSPPRARPKRTNALARGLDRRNGAASAKVQTGLKSGLGALRVPRKSSCGTGSSVPRLPVRAGQRPFVPSRLQPTIVAAGLSRTSVPVSPRRAKNPAACPTVTAGCVSCHQRLHSPHDQYSSLNI